MNEKIRKYIDNLFSDIPDSKQLRELKEEVNANLAEKISDAIDHGSSEEEAFKKAISELGDVSELADRLRRASNTKIESSSMTPFPIDKKHVIGYVIASTIALFGIMAGGVMQLQLKEWFISISTLLPFILVSTGLFVYFGCTQETNLHYGMSNKRALAYSLTTVLALFGLMSAGVLYFQKLELFIVVASLIPFIIPSAAVFTYLGLTEKKRWKSDNYWAREWMAKWNEEWKQNYSTRNQMVRGSLSGALWLFTIAIFLLWGFNGGWKISWIVFIFACGFEVLFEAIFPLKKKE